MIFSNLKIQFIKYFITGLSGTILDIGTLYIFKDLFHLRAVIAVMINQIIVVFYVFTLNKYWSFKSNGGLTHLQFIRFLSVMGLNYIIAIVWMWFWHDIFNYNYLLVRLTNIILSVSWNFLIYKYWVYQQERSIISLDV
jgi:dolichol-phosphate mannosyltransferase